MHKDFAPPAGDPLDPVIRSCEIHSVFLNGSHLPANDMIRPEEQLDFRSGHTVPMLLAVWIWACPATLLGLLIGGLGLCSGGTCRRIGHTLEFHGGLVHWFLERTPIAAAGMTLGHVILGISPTALDFVRYHEWVHIRQYERWGPFFLPAYLGCTLWLKIQGRDGYRENPFEVEAYSKDGLRRQASRDDPPDSAN